MNDSRYCMLIKPLGCGLILKLLKVNLVPMMAGWEYLLGHLFWANQDRAMDMAPGLPLTSCADCTSIHKGQQQVAKISLRNVPSMPFCSRILDRICAMKKMFASGTNVARPQRRQLSPTASAFLPAV